MVQPTFMSADDIRYQFSLAMSQMYQNEVPLYTDLLDLVKDVNAQVLSQHPEIKQQLENTHELDRLDSERHGAIRLGTAEELSTMRRLFAVMGMYPVGYYDLMPAGVPVHSTAFRAIDNEALRKSPFRVFTSLLRLESIADSDLREKAQHTLDNRQIFTDRALELIAIFESEGGLTAEQGDEFVKEALETFRWHETSPITKQLYEQLLNQHRLIADIVGFKGPHINHLTPRTLDIDAVQQGMSERGIMPKDIIEGPPKRKCPILLRQTSFKALDEAVNFQGQQSGQVEAGSHTARFGEIEQRGMALTPKGRVLYDKLLNKARSELGGTPNKDNADDYYKILGKVFLDFPDDYQTLHDEKLAYFYYRPVYKEISNDTGNDTDTGIINTDNIDVAHLMKQGVIRIEPIVYEDFLPVSAAGIFQSNLYNDDKKDIKNGDNNEVDSESAQQGNGNKTNTNKANSKQSDDKKGFEQALGTPVYDELELYSQMQAESLEKCIEAITTR